MPFAQYECTDHNYAEMDEIWNSFWSTTNIEKKLINTSKDELLPIFMKYLPKSGKILEGGCGLGNWVIYLNQKGYDVIGLDFSAKAINSIKEYERKTPVELGDITKTRFVDNYFSAYISLGVVEHFKEGPSSSLKEAKRILNRDGLLFISVPVFNSVRKITRYLEAIYNFLRENKYIRRIYGKRPYPKKQFVEYKYTAKEFEKILQNEGFSILNKFSLVHDTYSLFNYFLEPPSFLASKDKLFYRLCDKLAFILKRKSEWIAPHQIIWVCNNNK